MKYASSIRYGGQLIEAIDCDYDSYKDLGLLCPECKDPVFLRANTTQFRSGKEVAIASHFAHFPGKDPALVLACENRVKQYDAKELEKRARQSREQRRRLFNQHFYKIISKSIGFDDAMIEITKKDPEATKIVNNLIRVFSEKEVQASLKVSLSNMVDKISSMISNTDCEEITESLVIGFAKKRYKKRLYGKTIGETFAKYSFKKYDFKMHRMITREIIDFLSTKGAIPILFDLISHSISTVIIASNDDQILWEDLQKASYGIMDGSLLDLSFELFNQFIFFTPWVTALSEAAKNQANQATPRSPLHSSSLSSLPS